MDIMAMQIMNEIKNWLIQNLGTVQFLQFIIPIVISLLSIRFIQTKRRGPVLILDIKNIKEYPEDRQQKIKKEDYSITYRSYLLQIRNEGDSVALNVQIDSDNFKIVKYQNHQIGLQDEQFIKIVKKSNDEIEDINELNGEILKIYCETLEGAGFYFKYEIVNMEQKKVRFVSKGYGKIR